MRCPGQVATGVPVRWPPALAPIAAPRAGDSAALGVPSSEVFPVSGCFGGSRLKRKRKKNQTQQPPNSGGSGFKCSARVFCKLSCTVFAWESGSEIN